jgi:prepilin-type N-terminal cleavage/methylation domain-containing protein
MQARKKNRAARGFTLTELMVSLVMGLIVALAAVGLARTATTTFHEQARSTTTEMALRMASNRLRMDLMRTSYMSTGNIVLDPKVAKLEAAGTDPTQVPRYTDLLNLRGIKIDETMKSSDGGAIPATLTTNGIYPDALELVGNFTSDDAYTGTIQTGAAGASADGSCSNAQTIMLDTAADASTFTLGGGSSTGVVDPAVLTANAKAAFMPAAGKRFLAQVTDAIGCNHYVPVCDVVVTGASPRPVLQVMVEGPSGSRAVLYSNAKATDQAPVARNCGASDGGKVTIAPLMRVRWSLSPSTSTNLAADPGIESADKKVDLKRETLDFSGGTVFTEVIAEYMVDMKFGIVIDDPAAGGVGAARQKVIDIPVDKADINGDTIDKVTAGSDSVKAGYPGPQRVRAVRYRLSARTSVPDRLEDLPVDAGQIRARYCVDDTLSPCTKGWARVRTVTSEVVLTNQAGMFY